MNKFYKLEFYQNTALNKQNYSMPRNKKISFTNNSALQQNFIIQKTFQRNQRYFNLQKIKQIQNQYQTDRRRPFSSSQKSVDEKINSSFMNTTAAFSDKVQTQIGKFKLRLSGISGNEDFIQNQSRKSLRSFTPQSERNIKYCSSRSLGHEQTKRKKIKGMALDKYCTRQQYYQSKNKKILDQRLFNNYAQAKPDLVHTKDFQKYTDRDLDFSLTNFNDIQYNTQKLYQSYYYKKTTMQCNINYKSQKKKPRQLQKQKGPQDLPATQLSPQKVKQSFNKCSMLIPKPIQSFYANTGRQLPCQLDNRFNTSLTNFWVDNNGKLFRKNREYNLRKMKNDLIQAKIQQIKDRKNPKFSRDNLCDQKYFRVHKKI